MIYLFLQIVTTVAFSFTLNSSTNPNLKGWNTKDVSFLLNPNNCPTSIDLNGAIEAAMKVWNSVPSTNLKVTLGGTTSSTTHSNPPTIVCSTTFAADTGADASIVPGAGAVGVSGGRVAVGLLILNAQAGAAANIALYDPVKLKIVMAHEIGHVLGLGHSEDPSALMYYNASAKTELNLHQDDIEGISYLYARNELSGDGLLGCGLVGRNVKLPPNFGLFILVFLLPFLILLNYRMNFRFTR